MCKISFLELAYNQYIKHKKNYGKKFRKLSPTNSWNINLMVAIRKQRRIGDSKKFDQEDFGKIVNNWVEFSANYRKPPKGWSTTNTQKVRRWTKKNKWPMAVELAQQIFGHRLCAHANALDSNVIRTKEESLASEEKNNDEKERKKERKREREREATLRVKFTCRSGRLAHFTGPLIRCESTSIDCLSCRLLPPSPAAFYWDCTVVWVGFYSSQLRIWASPAILQALLNTFKVQLGFCRVSLGFIQFYGFIKGLSKDFFSKPTVHHWTFKRFSQVLTRYFLISTEYYWVLSISGDFFQWIWAGFLSKPTVYLCFTNHKTNLESTY